VVNLFVRLKRSRSAATASEYALILGVLAAVIVTGITAVNGAIYNAMNKTAAVLNGS